MMKERPAMKAALSPHLAQLRRYGRALTGSQRRGDDAVRALLEALLADPMLFQEDNASVVELFRLFHLFCWQDAGAPQPRAGLQAIGEGLLAELPRMRRGALLLTAVEGFSVQQVAQILGRDSADIVDDIAAARAELASQMAGRVLIIEDEPVIAMHLQDLVESMGHAVVGIAATHDEAIQLSREHATELVLADIRLADGSSGVEAVKDILSQHSVPVVFITAFPERLLSGERPEPTYLITKPFEDDMVIATIGQALLLHREVHAEAA